MQLYIPLPLLTCLVSLTENCSLNIGDIDEVCKQWQSRALIHKIGLPNDHYLRKSNPLPPSLIAAASVHIMPDCLRYELLAQPEPDTGLSHYGHVSSQTDIRISATIEQAAKSSHPSKNFTSIRKPISSNSIKSASELRMPQSRDAYSAWVIPAFWAQNSFLTRSVHEFH